MTPDELRQARAKLKLTLVKFGLAFDVNERTVRRWEHGAVPIPRAIGVLVRHAVKSASVRRELNI